MFVRLYQKWLCSLLAGLFLAGSTPALPAAGTGLNVVIVANQNSSNSLELANYYAEMRQVPPGNVLRINWSGGNAIWSRDEFEAVLLDPLTTMLQDRQLTNQVLYLVLSM